RRGGRVWARRPPPTPASSASLAPSPPWKGRPPSGPSISSRPLATDPSIVNSGRSSILPGPQDRAATGEDQPARRASCRFDPAALAVAAQDRLAQHHLAVSIGEGREGTRRLPLAGLDVLVNGAEELLERVGEALVVSAGIVGKTTHPLAQEG